MTIRATQRGVEGRLPPTAWALASRAAGLCFAIAVVTAQGQVLDLVDGETLYDGGFLVTVGSQLQREEVLREGRARRADAAASHQFESSTTLAVQYGLRHDLQIGIAVPYVAIERDSLDGQATAAGLGDVELLGKWRVHRWDAPGVSVNTACILALSLPTGEDHRRQGGVRLEPELQVGSGGFDPSFGFAVTPEPGRWRFNLAALYTVHTDSDGDGERRGDAFFAELAIGNRFWLEPYPGPFLRFDAFAHYYDAAADEVAHARLADTGGERLALGATLAFRPRPSLDLQLSGEVPVWHHVSGRQLDEDWSVQLSLGYRF